MTVPSATARSGPYACNGSLKNFTITFGFASNSDVEVVLINSSGVETVLTSGSNYSIAGTTVTTVSTYASGNSILLRLAPAGTQTTDLIAGGSVPADSVEGALDHLQRQINYLRDELRRRPALARASTAIDSALPDPVASQYLRWNAGATALENASASSITIAIADVVGLTAALAGKSDTSHTHTLSDITDAGDLAGMDLADLSLGTLATLSTVSTSNVSADAITFAKMQNVDSGVLLGRSTASSGDIETITIGAGLSLSGGILENTYAGSGGSGAPLGSSYVVIGADGTLTNERYLGGVDGITVTDNGAGSSVILGLGSNTIAGSKLANDGVTYAKIQNVSATSRVLGRVTAGAGDIEEIQCGAGLGFEGGKLVAYETWVIAIGDETTAITTGTAKVTFRMPYAFTLKNVYASLTTVSSSGNPTFDINEGGTTILSTKLSIDASEKTSQTAATAVVISDTSLAADSEITIDVDTAGTGAAGGKIYLHGYRP